MLLKEICINERLCSRGEEILVFHSWVYSIAFVEQFAEGIVIDTVGSHVKAHKSPSSPWSYHLLDLSLESLTVDSSSQWVGSLKGNSYKIQLIRQGEETVWDHILGKFGLLSAQWQELEFL